MNGMLHIRVRGEELDQLLKETVVSGDLTLKGKILSDHGIVVIVTLDAKEVLQAAHSAYREVIEQARLEFAAAHPDYQNTKRRRGK
jgi:hypothetical protein